VKRKTATWEWVEQFTAVAKPKLGALPSSSRQLPPASGDALALEWPDVDLDAGTALLRDTKNGEDRLVELLPEVREAFAPCPGAQARSGCSRSTTARTCCGRLRPPARRRDRVHPDPRHRPALVRHEHEPSGRRRQDSGIGGRVEVGADVHGRVCPSWRRSRGGTAGNWYRTVTSGEIAEPEALKSQRLMVDLSLPLVRERSRVQSSLAAPFFPSVSAPLPMASHAGLRRTLREPAPRLAQICHRSVLERF
jgi:hypothetical protein